MTGEISVSKTTQLILFVMLVSSCSQLSSSLGGLASSVEIQSGLFARDVHTCFLNDSGNLYCWGDNEASKSAFGNTQEKILSPTLISQNVISVGTGFDHTCLINDNRKLYCWGENVYSQLGDGTSVQSTTLSAIDHSTDYEKVDAGQYATCAITKTGALKCWGYNQYSAITGSTSATAINSPLEIDTGTVYAEVKVGKHHICAITNLKQIKCWGQNSVFQVSGATSASTVTQPMLIDNVNQYLKLSVADNYSCAITTNYELKCWGQSQSYFSELNFLSPTTVDSSNQYKHISVNEDSMCGLLVDGTLRCRGSNANGQLGDGTQIDQTAGFVTIDSANKYTDVIVGSQHTCGKTISGQINCWGDNYYAELGINVESLQNTPTQIDSSVTYSQVAIGNYHTCGITSDGILKCWGSNVKGQLGDQTVTLKTTPVVIDSMVTYSSVAAGTNFTCGITTAGALKCWGEGANYQLGTTVSSPYYVSSPVVVNSGTSYTAVSVGQYHGCGITTGSVLKCWGYNANYQVGDGTTTMRNSPVVIDSGTSYSKISNGRQHTCGITTAGVLKCWGTNSNGQIGNSTTTTVTSPTIIDSGITYASVSAGSGHTCGITTAGVLKCWGYNAYGQVGNNSTTMVTAPTVVSSGTVFTKVSLGENSTCALTTAGLLQCWGDNQSAQLGDGTSVFNRPSPTPINSSVIYTNIANGSYNGCAINNSNQLFCWGYVGQGAVGNGTKITYTSPVPVSF